MNWHNAKKELPEVRELDGLNMSISKYVLVIATSCAEAGFYIPEVSRLINGHWEFTLGVEDTVAYWADLPDLDEIEKEIEELEK